MCKLSAKVSFPAQDKKMFGGNLIYYLVKFKGDPTKIPKFIGLPLLSDEQQDMLELLFATKN